MSHILVIDDEPGYRTIIRLLLEEQGFRVVEAENGSLGLEAALANPPDLILCDIRMPEMDGFQTLSALRSNDSTATVPVLFLTGEDPRGNLRRAMELGANDFLAKPFDERDLLMAVKVRLDQVNQVRRRSQQDLDQLRDNITLALPHELRTPLTGLLGLAEILRTDVESMAASDIRDMANMVYAAAQRLHRTLDKFWTYSQVEILASDPQSLTVVLQQAATPRAEDVLRMAAERIAESYRRRSDLQLEIQPGSPAISEQHLDRIAIDLIENAFKFSNSGTPVHIRSETEEGKVEITIRDSGRGMSQEQIRSIRAFGQFERHLHEQQGIGLGLVTVKRLIEIYHGSFEIESTPGKGTCITVILPCAAA